MSKKYGDLYQRGYLDGGSELIYKYSPADIKAIVDRRWNQADDTERWLLIEIMKAIPDVEWSKYIFAAEKGQIAGSDLLLLNRDEIMNSSDEGIASADVDVKRGDDYYQRQIGALASYIAFVTLHQ